MPFGASLHMSRPLHRLDASQWADVSHVASLWGEASLRAVYSSAIPFSFPTACRNVLRNWSSGTP
jgi:hypothetical protein